MSAKNKKSKTDCEGPSGAEDDIYSQFISVTGASEEVARNMLEACNMELDIAIGMYLDSDVGEASRPRSSNCSPKRNNSKRKNKSKVHSEESPAPEDDEDFVRAPIPQKREQLIDDTVILNSRKIPSIASTKVRSVFDGFRDFRREAEEHQRAMLAGETSTSESESTPSTTATSFGAKPSKKLKTLEELFRPPVDLLYPGTFLGAREEGKGGNMWLLINIQNHKEFSCQCLNRDIWSHGAIRELVKQHFVFWQVYHDSSEGVKYEQFYPISQYPYIAILDPRTGERLLTLNKFDPLSFCETLTEFLRQHPSPDGSAHSHVDNVEPNPTTSAASSSKRKIGSAVAEDPSDAKKPRLLTSLVDESEDDQLQAAIRASLQDVDGPSKIRHPRETETTESDDGAETDEDLETFSSSDDEDDVTESARVSSADVASPPCGEAVVAGSSNPEVNAVEDSIPDDDREWQRHVGSNEDVKTKIIFRLPDGQRDQLEIPADSSLLALTLYVKSKGFSSERFELLTNFPRKKLSYMDSDVTLKIAGLFPQETVFVQEREIPLAD